MTIKTLEFIHSLLIDERERTKRAYTCNTDLLEEYEESGMVSADVMASQKKSMLESRAAYFAASDALTDFEAQEF